MEAQKPDTEGMPLKQYFNLKDRLTGEKKKKISISISSELLNTTENILQKEYKGAAISRLIEMLLDDFVKFHHAIYLENKEGANKS